MIRADRRPGAANRVPRNKLSESERQQILELCNSPEFASLPPNVIVPTLADKGVYIASESTFYRVLKSANQLTRRSRESRYKRPEVLKAVAPNQVWSWDISYLPSWIRGQHFYLYMIMDVYSRKIIATEVFTSESGPQRSSPVSPGNMLQSYCSELSGMKNVHPVTWYFILITEAQCAAIR